eukprot:scaffold661134_cov43-Prasinocladus_malaysianus.AAC.1
MSNPAAALVLGSFLLSLAGSLGASQAWPADRPLASAYLEPARHRKLAQAADPALEGCEEVVPLTCHF